MNYTDYLRTEHWQNVRAAWRRDYRINACSACGSRPAEPHHLHYDSLGRERATDFVGLCRTHHQEFHDWLNKVDAPKHGGVKRYHMVSKWIRRYGKRPAGMLRQRCNRIGNRKAAKRK